MKEIILASQSPRRKELMEVIGVPFKVEVANVDETMNLSNNLIDEIQILAKRKAEVIFKKNPDSIVVGADTIVVYGSEVLGKPLDEEDAKRMLKLLSGKTHQVLTGVCIVDQDSIKSYCSISDVVFNELTDDEIANYINTKEPMDKAGAYAIQGFGGCFIKEIKGDFYSIMGLPLSWVYQEISKKITCNF